LHNRNSISEIYTFIKKEFGKDPTVAEVTELGISPVKLEEYKKIYKNAREDLYQSENYEKLSAEIGLINPDLRRAIKFINNSSGNSFRRYSELFINGEKITHRIPTGTCFPFERKMYVTVNGKILPCERISHKYYFGKVINNEVQLDFENIALKINEYYGNLKKQCANCYNYSFCHQCIYYLKDLDREPVCNGFMTPDQLDQYISNMLSFIEKNLDTYMKSFDIVTE
jgi:uncharacterized protein